jgi:hypothetical protein
VLWIDVDGGWMPPGRGDAYRVEVRPSSAVVLATSAEQLVVALRDLEAKRKVEGGEIFLPLGLHTNLPKD